MKAENHEAAPVTPNPASPMRQEEGEWSVNECCTCLRDGKGAIIAVVPYRSEMLRDITAAHNASLRDKTKLVVNGSKLGVESFRDKTEQEKIPTMDLEQNDWEAIKRAASESPWIPKDHYFQNDWVSDVCEKELRGLRLLLMGDSLNAEVKKVIRDSLGVDLDEGTIK